MFAVPIDNAGLASFVPIRRQSGSSVGPQTLGFNIFGQPVDNTFIGGTNIGGTNIGQIPDTNIELGSIEDAEVFAPGIDRPSSRTGLASFVPVDEDSFLGPQPPTINTPELDFGESKIGSKISEEISEVGDKLAAFAENPLPTFNPNRGVFGYFENVLGGLKDDIDIARTAFNQAAQRGLPAILGAKAAAVMPVVDLMSKAIFSEEPITARDVVSSGAKALSTIALGPLGPVIVTILEEAFDFFFGEEDVVGPSVSPSGLGGVAADAFGAATEGLGIDISQGIDDFGDFDDDPGNLGFGDTIEGIDIAGELGISDDGPSGGSSGPSGDDGDAGAPGCWVAGTKILMADNTYCNIEDLKIGDMVMSFPETKKTRRWNTPLEPQPIISLLVDVHPEIWHLNDSMVSGTEWIIKGDGTAAIVQWLNVGDTVLGPDNNLIEVTRVEPAEGDLKKQIIYNFETKFNYSYTANNIRTIRGRAVRAPERGPWSKEYLSGETNAYEGSMKDEYNRKFKQIAA